MKFKRVFVGFASILVICCACSYAQAEKSITAASSATQEQVKPFLGRWDLTVKTPSRVAASWLDLYMDNGQLKADFVGRWGNSRPLPKVEITGGTLTFTSPKQEENSNTDLQFKATLVQGKLVGSAAGPNGTPWTWTGIRAPKLSATVPPAWGKPIRLFNGKNLDGWYEYSSNDFPQSGHWTVVNGALVSPGNGPELVSKQKFDNFKLHIEFNCGPVSNSGVYLRGRYEIQIENESADEPPSHHTGGVYGYIAPNPELPRTTGQWQTFDITFIGRRVTIVQNGKTIVDNKEIPGITGGALDSHEGLPGPIMLQGSEKGHVSFRNIVITPAVR